MSQHPFNRVSDVELKAFSDEFKMIKAITTKSSATIKRLDIENYPGGSSSDDEMKALFDRRGQKQVHKFARDSVTLECEVSSGDYAMIMWPEVKAVVLSI